MRFLIRLAITSVALWAAASIVPGIELNTESVWPVIVVAVIFGLVNAILGSILKLLSLPVILLTLGLFALVINAAMLLLTSALTQNLQVDGFLPALLGSLVISVVSTVLNKLVGDA